MTQIQIARLYTTSSPLGGRKFHVTDENNITPDSKFVLLPGKKQHLTIPRKHLVNVSKAKPGENLYKVKIGDYLISLPLIMEARLSGKEGILESKVNLAEEVIISPSFYLLLQQLSDEDGSKTLRRYVVDRGYEARKKLCFIKGAAEYLKRAEDFDNRLTTYGLGDKVVVDIARKRIESELKALGSSPRIEDYL